MRKFWILICVCWLWTCGGGGGGSPTEPDIELPTVQNIEFTIEEDTSKTFAFMGSDPLNRALTYSVSTQPQHGTLTINAGAGTYAPNANYYGADTFAYIATNVDGTSNIGTIVATVTPVDDEPNTMDVSATTDEDNAITITVEAEEYDGDNIIFKVRNNCSNCIPTNFSGNTYLYTPNQDWNGTDTFNFEAVDSNAKSVLNVATATITVNPVNDTPTVENIDAGGIQLNESKDITLVGSDVENDNLTYSIVSQPSKGTVTINGNVATYTASLINEDTFTYRAFDGTAYSTNATVNVNNFTFTIFGGTGTQELYSVQQTTDGGYILGGLTSAFGYGAFDMYIVKTDANGNEEWSNTIGGSQDETVYSVQQTTDGGYILGGSTKSFGNGAHDMYLVKTDANGNEEWSNNFGGSRQDFANSVQQTADGGYILGGTTQLGDSGRDFDMYIVKTDANGNEEWSNTIGGAYQDRGNSVQQTTDGGYIIGGLTQSFGINQGYNNMYIVKTDANGNEEWSKTIGGFSEDEAYSVQQTTDGGYIIGGYTGSSGNGNYDMYLVKTDANGNEEWSNTFGGSQEEIAYSVQQTTDGGYIVGGRTQSFGNGSHDMYLVKTDANGNEEWSNTFGALHVDLGRSVQQTTDGGYILGGYSFQNGAYDMYLVKTDSQGNQEW